MGVAIDQGRHQHPTVRVNHLVGLATRRGWAFAHGHDSVVLDQDPTSLYDSQIAQMGSTARPWARTLGAHGQDSGTGDRSGGHMGTLTT